MKTIYLLIRVSLDEEDIILGGYSSKEIAEAARVKYRSESTNTNDYRLCIRPLSFDSAPKVEGWDYDLGLTKICTLNWVQTTNDYVKEQVVGYYSTPEKAQKAEDDFLQNPRFSEVSDSTYIDEVALDIIPFSPTKEAI